jgi:hypothetical protein
MAYSLTATIPKLIDGKILRDLEKNLIAKQICTAKTDTPIKNQGDTVYFSSLADPTIGNYTGADFTYEAVKDAQIAMLIDQAKYFAFKINDVDKFQSIIDVQGSQIDRAMYGLRDAADTFLFGKYADAGTQLTEAGVTSATILSSVARISRVLDEKNVPTTGRWLAISPIVKERMVLAGIKFQIVNGGDFVGGFEFADYLGFKVYVSNNVNYTSTDETQVVSVMAGSANAICFADQIMKTKMTDLPFNFEMGCAGLYTYGAKVVKQKELVTSTLTFVSETAI